MGPPAARAGEAGVRRSPTTSGGVRRCGAARRARRQARRRARRRLPSRRWRPAGGGPARGTPASDEAEVDRDGLDPAARSVAGVAAGAQRSGEEPSAERGDRRQDDRGDPGPRRRAAPARRPRSAAASPAGPRTSMRVEPEHQVVGGARDVVAHPGLVRAPAARQDRERARVAGWRDAAGAVARVRARASRRAPRRGAAGPGRPCCPSRRCPR